MKKWQISKKTACVFLAGLVFVWIPGIAAAVSILDYGAVPGYATSSTTSPQPVVSAGNEAAYAMTSLDVTPGDYRPRPGAARDEGVGCGSTGFTPSDSLRQGETDGLQPHANDAPAPKPTPMILLGISLIGVAGFRKKFAEK